jgi:hypothetical protein
MKKLFTLLCLSLLVFSFAPAETQSISKKTAGMAKLSGYFDFYWDENTGKIWLEIDKFHQEFLYVSSLAAGLGSNDVGLDRNRLGQTYLVKFVRVGPKVLLIQPNYSFRASSDNPDEIKAVEDAFAQSVIWGFQAAAEEDGHVLIDASAFLVRDAVNAVGTMRRRNQGNFRLDPSRSAIFLPNTKNFPHNTEFEALVTLVSDNPGNYVRQVTPTAGAVTLRQHHSLIKLPDDDYKPRIYDPRSNFGSASYMDFAAPISEPLTKRFIRRHRLMKKDPAAKSSEAVEPIIYYIDRGAPEPIRSALIEGASWWNEAFEAAGYKNAFQAKLMPEGADLMDVRYNVVNWVHRSTRGWSYGSSVTDPRTGEIIKGHVALGSQRIRQDFLIASSLIADFEAGKEISPEMTEMALARIRQLSCHEVGHTLGMGHNYAASVNDRASVMDYPHPLIKISEDGTIDLSDAYDTGIGKWDEVSIAFGYQHFVKGVNEEKALRKILDDAFSRGLYFLAGQDAGAGSAHPLANVWDSGKHPVDELERVMKIRSIALKNFSEKRIRPHSPMALLEDVLVPAYMFHRYQVEAAASVLGGLYYNHTLRGDVQKDPEIVGSSEQRRALDVLLKTIHPKSLEISDELLKLIPPRPPGYRQTRELLPGYTGSTFDPLGAAEAAANLTVGLILHPQRAARLVDYYSRDQELPGLNEVLDELIDFTWKAAHSSSVHAEIQRVVNSVFLYRLMGLAVEERTSSQVRAVALLKLEELKEWLSGQLSQLDDKNQKAHFLYALSQIGLFQKDPESFKLTMPLSPPPGAPIGMYD